MKYIWAGLIVSMLGGFYFTPEPLPGEGTTEYILAGRETWQSFACTVAASICGAILIMACLMKNRSARD